MYTKIAVFALLVLALIGCTGSPQLGVASGSMPGPMLGIIADQDLRVLEVIHNSAADKAGVKVGDILVDLTWIPTEEAKELALPEPTLAPQEQAAATITGPITITEYNAFSLTLGSPAEAGPVDDYIEHGPVPFNESQRIISVASYGVPLRLKLIRDGQEVELVVVPIPRPERELEAGQSDFPELTPIPETYYGY